MTDPISSASSPSKTWRFPGIVTRHSGLMEPWSPKLDVWADRIIPWALIMIRNRRLPCLGELRQIHDMVSHLSTGPDTRTETSITTTTSSIIRHRISRQGHNIRSTSGKNYEPPRFHGMITAERTNKTNRDKVWLFFRRKFLIFLRHRSDST